MREPERDDAAFGNAHRDAWRERQFNGEGSIRCHKMAMAHVVHVVIEDAVSNREE
ncbi:MAG: hypothetical protein OXH76_08875 [Boseongicola sp.]|nr:hypothetical protein [Boseongicola sp.]